MTGFAIFCLRVAAWLSFVAGGMLMLLGLLLPINTRNPADLLEWFFTMLLIGAGTVTTWALLWVVASIADTVRKSSPPRP